MKLAIFVAASLLHATAAIADGAAAQCTPLTSYIPVTYTVTSYVTPTVTVTETATPAVQEETFTSTSTHYMTIQVSQMTTAGSTTGLYSYVVQSGTTSWFGSAAPSSGQSLVYVTTTVYVQPSPPSTVSTLNTITVSPPPYVSTSYSAPNSDVISTLTTTRTSTTTFSTVVTQIRSSFTPIGSLGWNSTNTDLGGTSFILSSGTGVPTTITGTVYWSSGSQVISTSYNTITTTLTESVQLTSTITPTETETVDVSSSAIESPGTSSEAGSSSSITSSSVAVGPSTAAASSSQSSLPSQVSSSTDSGFIPTSVSTTQTYGIIPASYGGYGGFSTVDTGLMSSISAEVSSSVAAITSQSSASETVASSSSAVVSPVTQSYSVSSSASALATSATSVPFGTSTISAVQSSTISSALVSGSAVVSPSMAPSSVILSASIPVGSSAAPVTSSTIASSPLTSIPASSSTAASSAAASSVTGSSPVAASSAFTSSGFASSPIASSSSTIPALPTISGYPAYGLPTPSTSLLDASPVAASSSAVSTYKAAQSASSSAALFSSSPTGLAVYPLPSSVNGQSSAMSPVAVVSSSSSASATSVTASSIISSISATPSVCGEHGNFTLNFDDLPNFSTTNGTDITQAPPIFDGYHHFAFSDGYVYAPPPNDPFPPTSPPHLAVFLGNASGSGLNNTPSAMAPTSGFIRPGEFGDGSSAAQSAFWFNIYSAWLGCDNSGPEVCTYVLTAYTFDAASQSERQLAITNATTSPCPGFSGCHLQQVDFPSSFQGLSGVQIQAYRGQDQVMFFMDDVSMGWYNNTCAAGLQRLQSPRGGGPAVARR